MGLVNLTPNRTIERVTENGVPAVRGNLPSQPNADEFLAVIAAPTRLVGPDHFSSTRKLIDTTDTGAMPLGVRVDLADPMNGYYLYWTGDPSNPSFGGTFEIVAPVRDRQLIQTPQRMTRPAQGNVPQDAGILLMAVDVWQYGSDSGNPADRIAVHVTAFLNGEMVAELLDIDSNYWHLGGQPVLGGYERGNLEAARVWMFGDKLLTRN